MRAMLKVQARRKKDGKDSAFLVRGRPVDPKKLARYFQRKGDHGSFPAADLTLGGCSGDI